MTGHQYPGHDKNVITDNWQKTRAADDYCAVQSITVQAIPMEPQNV